MARPKKSGEDLVIQNEDLQLETTTAELTHTALANYLDPVTKLWHHVQIKFNPETGDVGELQKQAFNSREEAVDQFKINAVKHDFVG